MPRPFFALLCVLLLNMSCQATVYHVDISATGSGTGLTWENAFTGLQDALSIVVAGDEIWVAAGQYKPTTGTSRTVSFVLRNGVNIYGGFAGDETDLAQRDIAANPTVLNGDIGEIGDNTDNSYSVVTANNINTSIILDGFRIMNGRGNSSYNGGGMRLTNALGGNILLRNLSIMNNYSSAYGGGLYLASANVSIESCEFYGNYGETGGAICNANDNGGSSVLVVRDSRFRNNESYQSACYDTNVSSDTLIFDRCIFTNNISHNRILDFDQVLHARLANSLVVGNTVDNSSGNVVYVSNSGDEDFAMINCTVANNFNIYSSIQSECIKIYGTGHVISNSIIYGNTAYNGRQVSINEVISHSIVQGGHPGGTAIIDQDPLFTIPYNGAPANFDATGYDYTPSFNSPAINSGDNSMVAPLYDLDLAQSPRIQGDVVDLGCYETDLSTSVSGFARPSNWYFDGARSEIHLSSTDKHRSTQILIHDLSGRRIAAFNANRDVIGIDLPPGVYVATSDDLGMLKFGTQ